MTRILCIQTAFAGDLILTLPLMQEVRRLYPEGILSVLCIPSTAALLEHHPAVDEVLVYDKHRREGRRGHSMGLGGIARMLRRKNFDMVLSPHRSLRSALLARLSGAARRISFDTSAGKQLFTDIVRYCGDEHEAVRNLRLLSVISDDVCYDRSPELFPGKEHELEAEKVFGDFSERGFVVMAPGSVWATKRWVPHGFAVVVRALAREIPVVLIGGSDDTTLCEEIRQEANVDTCINAAGELSFLGSAALLRRAKLLISNDSAPVHMASAVNTPVVEIFGATVPEFGFTPFGVAHRIVQHEGLDCRPCAIHGGRSCPIGSFECMRELSPETALKACRSLLEGE